MFTHPEREAIEHLIPRLRPCVVESDSTFVTPDGKELRVAGISKTNFPGGDRTGDVAVLCETESDVGCGSSNPVQCSGVVVLRRETAEERKRRNVPDGFAATCVVQGVCVEFVDDQGRSVVFPVQDVEATFPLLITDR